MAQLYSTGPAHIYVGTLTPSGGISTAYYYGTCEQEPGIEEMEEWVGEKNSIGGEAIPFDKSYQGKHVLLDLDMNRYNETVDLALAASPGSLNPAFVAGTNGPGDLGSLLLTEGLAFATWVVFEFGGGLPGFAGKPVMTANGMVAGYRFLACSLDGPQRHRRWTTRSKKVNRRIHCIRAWSPSTQTFTCYDFNVAGLPAIN